MLQINIDVLKFYRSCYIGLFVYLFKVYIFQDLFNGFKSNKKVVIPLLISLYFLS